MEETCLIRLFHGNAKNLNLVGKKMKYIPLQLSQLENLLSLELNNNNLASLPDCLCSLNKVLIFIVYIAITSCDLLAKKVKQFFFSAIHTDNFVKLSFLIVVSFQSISFQFLVLFNFTYDN